MITKAAKFLQLALGFVLFLFVFISTSPSVQAFNQTLKFKRISTQDGLSQSGASEIIQDDLGFMWFATQYGLNRYDGVKFDYFYHDIQDPNSISSNDITRLDKDNSRIWVMSSHGLDSINQLDLTVKNWSKLIFRELIERKLFDKKTKGSIFDFRVTESHLYALLNDKLLVSVALESEQVKVIPLKENGLTLNEITGIVILPDNQLLVSSGKCYYSFSLNSGHEFVDKFCPENRVPHRRFQTSSYQNGYLLLASDYGLYVVNVNDKQEKIIKVYDSKSASNVGVTAVLEVEQGYWLGTESGLKFYDKNTEQITKEYFHDTSDEFSLSNNDILGLYQSQDGVLWIGTGFGINLLKPDQKFQHLLRKNETDTFKLSNLSTTITEDANKNLWIGTSSSGLYRYQANKALLNNYLVLSLDKNADFTGFVGKVFEDNNLNLWVLSDSGLSVKSLDEQWFKTLKYYSDDGNEYEFTWVLDIIQDRHSNYWFGGADGLFKLEVSNKQDGRLDLANIKVTNYSDKLPQNYLFGDYAIYVLYEDLQGYIWIGGSNGLVRFNPNNLSSQHYTFEDDNSSSISSNDINTIYEDFNGVLWIGTANGLNRVFYNDNGAIRFKRIGVKDGFVSNYISAIQADDKGFLWISTIKGIIRYHPSNIEPVVNYLYEEGLQHDEFFTKASYQDQAGTIYFGGVNGVTAFNPLLLEAESNFKPIVFSKIAQGTVAYQLNQSNELKLTNNLPLTIRVSNFDYLSNRPLKLRYRLSHNEWIEPEGNEVILHDFAENQELEVQQLSPSGQWVRKGLKLTIQPSFNWLKNTYIWLSAILAMALMAMVLLYWLYKNLSQQKSKASLLLKREKAKQSLLMEEKLSLLHQVEDLHYSLSEQKYLVDKIQNELEQKSIKDELTNLYSRGYIIKNIQHELDNILATWQHAGHEGLYLGVFCVEIDNFNSLKDQYGFIATNEVLVQVAESIKNICYGSDVIARWQGSSILILSRGISKREQMLLAEKIRNIIASRKFDLSNGKTIDITASVGFSRFPFLDPEKHDKRINWFKLIYLTETALSSAQTNSLNAWIGIFSNQFTDQKSIEDSLLNELPELINSGQLDYVSSIPKSKKIQWD
ncbi:MAG: diguanylate cyclase [Gammaproteobacteria bacterium]|nr:diguanylate cyclase [Gammaproteobacteria bacterium]